MRNLDRSNLTALFSLSLAVAHAACGATRSPDGPADPGQSDPTAGSTEVTIATPATAGPPATAAATAAVIAAPDPAPSDAQSYAKQFHSVDSLAAALPGMELLGFIDIEDGGTKCTPGPCKKAWTDLITKSGARAAVVKKDGALAVLMESDLAGVLGTIDTKEKAALRARLADYHVVATCAQVAKSGFSCADGSSAAGIPVRRAPDGFEVATFGRRDVCGGSMHGSTVALGVVGVSKTGEVHHATNVLTEAVDAKVVKGVECKYPTRGRMFAGFVDLPCERTELEYHVRAYRQEASAVLAFERLARELAEHGAPPSLVRAARRSADQERRHAAAFRREAERLFASLGLAPAFPALDAPAAFAPRSLEELLVENAREGCVNETYAAVVATHQAANAPTPGLRRALRAIAADERGHADLAHRVHAWGLGALPPDRAAAVEAALAEARDQLRASPNVTPVGLTMGEPDAAVALAAFDHVSAALHARAA